MMLKTKSKIRIAKIVSKMFRASRKLVGLGDEVTVVRGGLRWCLDLREGIDFAIYLRGSFEKELVYCYTKYIGTGGTVLDIGANIGANTLPLASNVGERGRVIAFEPTDYAVQKLHRNVHLNPQLVDRISIEQIMLTNSSMKEVPLQFYARWPLDKKDRIHETHMGALSEATNTSSRTLDDYLHSHDIEKVDFIKLDVDGGELEVLEGGREMLARIRPPIVLELAPYVYDSSNRKFQRMLKFLFELGYGLHSLRDNSRLSDDPEIIESSIPSGAGINVLALPK